MVDEIDSLFSSIMLCYFLDSGPCSIDFYSLGEIVESPDLTAVRLMTKSTALVKGDSSQQVELSIINQLSGPDIYPVDTKYRMVWYNWLIANQYSNDPRIQETGAIAGIYCIYEKQNEKIVRNSLEIIEQFLRNISRDLSTIDDIIRQKLNLSSNRSIKREHFNNFIEEKDSNIITQKICRRLNSKVQKNASKSTNQRLSQSGKFKIILQNMIFKKGSPEEIVEQSEKKLRWNSVIQNIDKIIQDERPNLMIKEADEKKLKNVYQFLIKEEIWLKILDDYQDPLIQTNDVANFFFYYWLGYHKLLKKEKIIQLYIKLTN